MFGRPDDFDLVHSVFGCFCRAIASLRGIACGNTRRSRRPNECNRNKGFRCPIENELAAHGVLL
jgi:hypothetical protein